MEKMCKRLGFFLSLGLLLGSIFSCSTSEIVLESTDFKFLALTRDVDESLQDSVEGVDLIVLDQVLTKDQCDLCYEKGFFVFQDEQEVSLLSRRPFNTLNRWLIPTVPGKPVPGVVYQLGYEFGEGRYLDVFMLTLSDQVDVKEVAQLSEMIDRLFLSMSGSAILIVSSDDIDYAEVLRRRIIRWQDFDIRGGDYRVYSSVNRTWTNKTKRLDDIKAYEVTAKARQENYMRFEKE